MKGKPGYFTERFCEKARFFHPKNGSRVDAIREAIERKDLPSGLKSVLLVSLMEAADRVDSTTGLQMAYLKEWAPRAHNDLELRMPAVLKRARYGKGRACHIDAAVAAKRYKADIAYIDPPYNQHSYLGNYHIWESLILWDKPETYGLAQKRIDCRSRKSNFNSKTNFYDALCEVIASIQAKVLVVSFNNEGYISREKMEELLASRGAVRTFENDYKRYVGAQIGIYNPQGEKVGSVSHLRNKEYLYIVEDPNSFASEVELPKRRYLGEAGITNSLT
jgi:adenine-specific DNA-methyltransferase